MHCFQGLKEHSREKRVEVFRAVLSSTIDSMAQKLADGVVAAGHYAMQQEQGQHSGKFAGMVLGDLRMWRSTSGCETKWAVARSLDFLKRARQPRSARPRMLFQALRA